MRVEQLTQHIGAELVGVNLAEAVHNDDLFGEIRAALLLHKVLFLRDQDISRADLPAWLPSYFNRVYHLPVDKAGSLAAALLLICGTGMILCGMVSDRLARERPEIKITLAIGYCLGTGLSLTLAMLLPPGPAQLALLGIAMFLVAGTVGPVGAMVANLTPLAIHGSAFATLTLANNLLGLAPGPILTGRIADAIGLADAFLLLPVPCLLAALTFAAMRRNYLGDLRATSR